MFGFSDRENLELLKVELTGPKPKHTNAALYIVQPSDNRGTQKLLFNVKPLRQTGGNLARKLTS